MKIASVWREPRCQLWEQLALSCLFCAFFTRRHQLSCLHFVDVTTKWTRCALVLKLGLTFSGLVRYLFVRYLPIQLDSRWIQIQFFGSHLLPPQSSQLPLSPELEPCQFVSQLSSHWDLIFMASRSVGLLKVAGRLWLDVSMPQDANKRDLFQSFPVSSWCIFLTGISQGRSFPPAPSVSEAHQQTTQVH